MNINFYSLLLCGLIFIPPAGLVAWIVQIEKARFHQRIDQKIADEIRRRYSIDGLEGHTIDHLMPDITYIRDDCKKENRYLFLIDFLASFISLFGGAVFVLRSPIL